MRETYLYAKVKSIGSVVLTVTVRLSMILFVETSPPKVDSPIEGSRFHLRPVEDNSRTGPNTGTSPQCLWKADGGKLRI